MKTLAALLLLFLTAAGGCMHVAISRASDKAWTEAGADAKDFELNSFAWGFVPANLPPESEVCPKSRIDTVRLEQNGTDVFLTGVTFGIYVPHRAEITCSTALNGSH